MKKIVILFLFISIGLFANKVPKNQINILKIKTERLYVEPTKYVYETSCGKTAVSYSYEPVTAEQLKEWQDAMEEYYCSEL